MAIRVVEFSKGGRKLERFLHKNQPTQRKLLNFEFRINAQQVQVLPSLVTDCKKPLHRNRLIWGPGIGNF